MRILVTGAAGFIGSHLAEKLARQGHTVVGLDCFTVFYPRQLKELNARQLSENGVSILPLDLACDELGAAVNDAEMIYHLAAQPGLAASASFESYLRDNFVATHRLLDAARHSPNLRAFINISTSSVYGSNATGDEQSEPRPTSWYGVTKLAAEQLVMASQREAKLPACSFRLFSVYGPRERPDKLFPTLIRCLLTDQPFPLFEGSEFHERSFTYVADIVDGLAAAITKWEACCGQIINLGIDSSITTGEAIRIVQSIMGKPANIQRYPHRQGDQARTQANIAKARELLNYNPTTEPADGLRQTIDWYTEHMTGHFAQWPPGRHAEV